jgi:hypothetical protein
MDTPLEESNLAFIGSDEDKAAREAAAKLEVNWEGAGAEPGIQIWRVENKRVDDVPHFGINAWPEAKYGQFYRGDSYIVLQTRKKEDGDALYWDIYFWIGSASSQDEYGVVAYKTVELDDLLGGAPVQHREVEKFESAAFMSCFPKGVTYLEGGIDSGFREVGADSNEEADIPKRLFRVFRKDKTTRSVEVPLACSSLNDGDAFILDAGNKIYTWFGSGVSAFEKNESASIAQQLTDSRGGHAEFVVDVGDDNEDFWSLLGGKGDIAPAEDAAEPPAFETKMYILSDAGGSISIKKVDVDKSGLDSGNVVLIDGGSLVIIWIGKDASKAEQQQAMLVVDNSLRIQGRMNSATAMRVLEGQEDRCPEFDSLFG